MRQNVKKYFNYTSLVFSVVFLLTFFAYPTYAQKSLPSYQVKDLNNRMVDTKTFSNDGKPIILCFWATWCKPCLEEMKVYHELYEEWQEKTGVKLIAVAIDDSRNSRKVAPFIKGKGWNFEVYLDENQDFMRAMNVTNPPHTFILDGNGEVVWSHIGFAQGDEEELFEQVLKLVDNNKEGE